MATLPSQGFVFWPVGTGDSTTVIVNDKLFVQVDLHHMECSNEDNDPHSPIIHRLIENLPRVGKKPYLALFVLTHPDKDHCQGFKELLDQVNIGELWFTPRIFREYNKDLCDDAKAFKQEAERRVKVAIDANGELESGDRVRIIGYDELLQEEEFDGFPSSLLTIPGNSIVEIDGNDVSALFRTFVHAPFKDDSDGERNDTSVGLQITLFNEDAAGNALLLGDLCYPIIRQIFDRSEADDLRWNVFLTPHQCSKSVMYWKGEEEEDESLKQDILDSIEKNACSPGYIVASCDPIPASNKPGENPPHAKAKSRYLEIVPDEFLCTQEHPNKKNPKPIIFELTAKGLEYMKPEDDDSNDAGRQAKKGLAEAVAMARGTYQPPKKPVGFGIWK